MVHKVGENNIGTPFFCVLLLNCYSLLLPIMISLFLLCKSIFLLYLLYVLYTLVHGFFSVLLRINAVIALQTIAKSIVVALFALKVNRKRTRNLIASAFKSKKEQQLLLLSWFGERYL